MAGAGAAAWLELGGQRVTGRWRDGTRVGDSGAACSAVRPPARRHGQTPVVERRAELAAVVQGEQEAS